MPKKCCITNCRIEQDDPVGRHQSFFKFPKDENEKKKWHDSISKEITIQLTKFLYVCSLHFEENSYTYTEANVRRIKKGCYPTIFTDFKRKQDALHQQSGNTDKDVSSDNINDFDTHEMEFNSDSKIGILTAKEIWVKTEDYILDRSNSLENEDLNLFYRSNQYNGCDNMSPNCHINGNIPKKNEENSLVTDCLQLEETFKKSIANIDPTSIAFTSENLPKLKRLFFKAHKEVTDLRRRMKANRTKIYRYKKNIFQTKNFLQKMNISMVQELTKRTV